MLRSRIVRPIGRGLIRALFSPPLRRLAERLAVLAGHRWPYSLPGRGAIAREIGRFKTGTLVGRLVCGAQMSVPASPDGISLFLTGALMDEAPTIRCLQRHLRPGAVFLDIGANLGFYTLLARSCVGPGGHVHAFEPRSDLVQHLRDSVALNNFPDNVTVVTAAVTDHDGDSVPLHYVPGSANGGEASLYAHDWLLAGRTMAVPTVTIDRHLAGFPGAARCVVKMDIEGAELVALRGMAALLAGNRVALLIIELASGNTWWADGMQHRRHRDAADAADVISYLAPFGFRPIAILPSGELGPSLTAEALAAMRSLVNVAFVKTE